MSECFEFDPAKSGRNEARHGIDSAWAQTLWDETHIIIPAKHVRGENRQWILAKMDGKLYAAIFTGRGDAIRLISCHRADRRLERIYEERVENKKTH